jgi:hypothetical protein
MKITTCKGCKSLGKQCRGNCSKNSKQCRINRGKEKQNEKVLSIMKLFSKRNGLWKQRTR